MYRNGKEFYFMSNDKEHRVFLLKEIKIHTDKSNTNYNHSYKYYVKTCVHKIIYDYYSSTRYSVLNACVDKLYRLKEYV